MNARGSRTWIALALQLAALVALCLSLFGRSWFDARSQPRLLVLVDRSQSVPRADADKALAEVAQAAKAAGVGELQLIEFAGRAATAANATTAVAAAAAAAPAEPSAPVTGPLDAFESAATNIEAALEAALAAHAQSAYASAVIISDGLENVGDTARALDAVRAARLPLQWLAVGRAPPPTRIAQVLAPQRALAGQRIDIGVQLAGQWDRPLRVKATARTLGGETRVTSGPADNTGRATLAIDADRSGAVRVDVTLEDPATGRVLDALPDAALIDIAPRAAILYVQGSTGPLARSLIDGGWTLNVVAAAQLDAQADALAGYQVVVLDDVAVSAASPRFWQMLAAAVRQRGLGLLVLGGEHAFARGGYRESTLESVLPVLSEPAALDQPAAIVFAVDKSGSMGQGSGGVDRFALAQRAVLETARGLTERDSLGLVVFDVVPRVLIPLGPAAAGTLALERDWQASPNGGTKLAPALDAAIGQLERSAAARRMLVLVTDGFVDDLSLAGLRARLEASRIETIALAVGPDADVDALQRLVGEGANAGAGLVLRVEQAAALPLAMRSSVERRRSRVERGAIAVQQRQPLPFPPGTWSDWPTVTAYAVTRSRPEAVVALQSQRGDPLIAYQNFGLGRVVVVTSGLGPWTPLWLRWKPWPQLAGGLADWIGGTDGAVSLAVSDLSGALQVDAEVRFGLGPNDVAGVSITVDTPVSQGQLLTTETVAPGRLRAMLPNAGPGLYTFVVSDPRGIRRHLHLRRERAENEAWGINPALDTWVASGVVSRWQASDFARHREGVGRPVDRSWIVLALALFLSGVAVDRTRLDKATITQAVRRWRRRA